MDRFGQMPVFGAQGAGLQGDDAILTDFLRRVRETLDMDVVFVSEFTRDRREFRLVNTADGETAVQVGASDPLEDSYCQLVVEGRLPKAVPDARLHPLTAAMPATAAVGVGAHLSVPIILRGGKVFGTLCCFSHAAQPGLGAKDISALEAVAEMVAAGIDRHGLFRTLQKP